MPFNEKPSACPICKKQSELRWLQDHKKEHASFSLYECQDCRVQFWMPLKNPGHGWYEREESYSVLSALQPRVTSSYHKKFLLRYGHVLAGKTVLDVGCGAGEFLAEAKKRGASVFGVEFDAVGVAMAKKYFGLETLYAMPLEEFFKKADVPQFDFITCFEVIEHVQDPALLALSLAQGLKPKGRLVLSTPSRERVFANLSAWDFPPHHLTRWNENAFALLFKRCGLSVAHCEYLDAFGILMRAMHYPFRLRLEMIKRVQGIAKSGPPSFAFTRMMQIAGVLKRYLVGGVPALFFFLLGRVTRRKNGRMYAEFAYEKS